MPRTVAKPAAVKETEAWPAEEVDRFVDAIAEHRFAVALRMGVLYGLRRSEALALRWEHLDTEAGTLRIDEGLIAVRKGAVWSEAKNERSRRGIPLDEATLRAFTRRRRQQAEERLAAGSAWQDEGLVTTTRQGKLVLPRSLDRALALIVAKAELPRLTSHGLRPIAATHIFKGRRI